MNASDLGISMTIVIAIAVYEIRKFWYGATGAQEGYIMGEGYSCRRYDGESYGGGSYVNEGYDSEIVK